MNHGLDAVASPPQRREVADVGPDKFILGRERDGTERGDIEQAQREMFAQQGDDFPAHATAGTRDEDALFHAQVGQAAR